jgi:C4-dicarboxylate-specific signal transduction histidine kinase
LKSTVETGIRFFSHVWKDGVQREVDVPEGLEVRGDSNQFVQVFINLVQNALDAMARQNLPGGRASPHPHFSGRAEGDKVAFTLRDNGPGIPAAIRDKIFDPFFTTKDVGKGDGPRAFHLQPHHRRSRRPC